MSDTQKYHHGDLRSALLEQAKQQLRSEGIEQLSLRKLAEQVGVSRTAPYHHFKDKHELLCALATEGFEELQQILTAFQNDSTNLQMSLRTFVRAYLDFALDNPETYELMFGRLLWKTKEPTAQLKKVAFDTFRHYAEQIMAVLEQTKAATNEKPLRFAQASWATLHGLCRLFIDGIYVNRPDVEEVSETSVNFMLNSMNLN